MLHEEREGGKIRKNGERGKVKRKRKSHPMKFSPGSSRTFAMKMKRGEVYEAQSEITQVESLPLFGNPRALPAHKFYCWGEQKKGREINKKKL